MTKEQILTKWLKPAILLLMAITNNKHLFGLVPILFMVFIIFALGMTILSAIKQTNTVINASPIEEPLITSAPQY